MKKMINRNKLISLQTIFSRLEDFFEGRDGKFSPEFLNFAIKNLKSINAELELINSNPALQYPSKYTEYEDKRIDLLKEYAELDENGNFILLDGTTEATFADGKREEYNSVLSELREEYKDVITEADEINKVKEEFMNGESELDVYTIYYKSLPDFISKGKAPGWSTAVYEMLSDVIEYDD